MPGPNGQIEQTTPKDTTALSYEAFLLHIDETYALEKLDPKHRPVGKSSQLYQKFCDVKNLKSKVLDLITDADLKAQFVKFMEAEEITDNDKQVKYLDQQAAQQYQVKFVNGILCDNNGNPLDTLKHKGKQDGYDAFVLDKNGQLFIAPHIKGESHHSTFTSGDDVLCSGMIKIEKGKVRVINNNSGHYKPDELHLSTLFYLLKSKDVFDEAKALDKRNLFVRGVLSFLMVLGLYRPTPRVQVVGRSKTLVKVGHALISTKFRPFYWLGRAMDESQVSHHIPTEKFAKKAGEHFTQEPDLRKAIDQIDKTNMIEQETRTSTLASMSIFSHTPLLSKPIHLNPARSAAQAV